MLKTMLGLAVGVAVLGGCAADQRAGISVDPPQKCRVGVFVTSDGYVVVDNDPVHPKNCSGGNAVTWHSMTGQYKFDTNGIAFDKGAAPAVSCAPAAGGQQFICTFGAAPTGTFPYSIRVVGPGGSKKVDPSVIVD
jgi:hypothetical protein